MDKVLYDFVGARVREVGNIEDKFSISDIRVDRDTREIDKFEILIFLQVLIKHGKYL